MNDEKKQALVALGDAISAAHKAGLFDREILDNVDHPDTINRFIDAVTAAAEQANVGGKGAITIPLSEYLRLKEASERLSRLEAGGVDNWSWYFESLNPEGEETVDEYMERIEKEIRGEGK